MQHGGDVQVKVAGDIADQAQATDSDTKGAENLCALGSDQCEADQDPADQQDRRRKTAKAGCDQVGIEDQSAVVRDPCITQMREPFDDRRKDQSVRDEGD